MAINKKLTVFAFNNLTFSCCDPLNGVTQEMIDICKPKLMNDNLKLPVIFGTSGYVDRGTKNYKEMWDNPKSYDYDEVFIPAVMGHWNDPIEPLNYGDKISKDDLENLVDDALSKKPIPNLFDQFNQNPDFVKAMKDITFEEFDSRVFIPDLPRPKRGSNYTKPKKRKNKKR